MHTPKKIILQTPKKIILQTPKKIILQTPKINIIRLIFTCFNLYLIVSGQILPDLNNGIPLKIGFLADTNLQKQVFELAFQDIFETVDVDPRINLTYEVRIGCKEGQPVYHASELYYKLGATAFIGPGCISDQNCVSSLASYWNLPKIAFLGTSIEEKKKENVFFNINAANIQNFANAFIDLAVQANWPTFFVIYDPTNEIINAYVRHIEERVLNMDNLKFDKSYISVIKNSTDENSTEYGISDMTIDYINQFTRVVFLLIGRKIQIERQLLSQLQSSGITSDKFVIFLTDYDRNIVNLTQKQNLTFLPQTGIIQPGQLTVDPQQKQQQNLTPTIIQDINNYEETELYNKCLTFGSDKNRSLSSVAYRFFNRLNNEHKINVTNTNDTENFALIYDALKLYILTINNIVQKDGGKLQKAMFGGFEFIANIKNLEFEGASGSVKINENSERVPMYSMSLILTSQNKSSPLLFTKIGTIVPIKKNFSCDSLIFNCSTMQINAENWLDWQKITIKGTQNCHFNGGECMNKKNNFFLFNWYTIIIFLVILSFIVIVVGYYLWRKARRKILVENSAWLIHIEKIQFVSVNKENEDSINKEKTSISNFSMPASNFLTKNNDFESNQEKAIVFNNLVKLRRYKQIKTISFDTIETQLLNQIKQLVHDNVNPLVGISCNNFTNELLVLWKYCIHGTLAHYLHNSELQMDANFKIAFMRDIIAGLDYLHNSPFGYHGYMHSSNCLIDANFIVKVVAVGIEDMLDEWQKSSILEPICYQSKTKTTICVDENSSESKGKTNKNEIQKALFENEPNLTTNVKNDLLIYRAPEILRHPPPTRIKMLRLSKAEQLQHKDNCRAADVYSLGMLIYEIAFRRRPFSENELPISSIIKTLKINTNSDLRPDFPKLINVSEREYHPSMLSLIKLCWHENPLARPNMRRVRKVFNSIYKINGSLVTSIIAMMDQHSFSLEKQVRERTRLLEEAQLRADRLLTQMLPRDVARDLKLGKPILPRAFQSSSVLFTDIVSFTTICATSTPFEIVQFLNDLFTGYDNIIGQMDAFKVETIGDAYMVVSGVPKENGSENASVIAKIALKMKNYLIDYKLPHMPEHKMQARWGIHTGPVAAGVVGLTAPRYCLFGDTVNMASRMESSSEPEQIQISSELFDLLTLRGDNFYMQKRGLINLKGKGQCVTYWLLGENVDNNLD